MTYGKLLSEYMHPRLNFISLAVHNLEKALVFYRDGLGLPTDGVMGREFHDEITGAEGTIAFFQLQGDLMLGLYERSNLAKDASIPLDSQSSTEFSLGYAVKTKEEVDKLIKIAVDAGATMTKEPHDRPWGVYSGYFKDLDGHLWEITYDPRIKVED